MVGRVLTGGTPDTAVAIYITLACNRSSVYGGQRGGAHKYGRRLIRRFQFGELRSVGGNSSGSGSRSDSVTRVGFPGESRSQAGSYWNKNFRERLHDMHLDDAFRLPPSKRIRSIHRALDRETTFMTRQLEEIIKLH